MLEKLSAFIPRQAIEDTVTHPSGELMSQWGNAFNVLVDSQNVAGEVLPNNNNATRFASVYACINVLSDDIAKLPWKSYQQTEKNIEKDSQSDVAYVLNIRPNRFMSPFVYKKLIVTDVCTYGNHYSYISFDKDGGIDELIPLDPSSVQIIVDRQTRNYAYRANYKEKQVEFLPHEIYHVKALSTDGILGLSPLQSIRKQMATMDIATNFNKRLIEKGGTPKGILEVEGVLDSEAKKKARAAWERVNTNESIAVVDLGMKYKTIGVSQEDMQFLEMMKFSQQQIASIFKVPLHKINDLTHATYTNIEHQSLDYVKNTLQPWVTQLEEEANFKLYTEQQRKEGYYCKFNMDSELRGDSESRAKVQQINLSYGMKSLNEIRSQNEDSPYENSLADEPLMTLNLVPLSIAVDAATNRYGASQREPNEKGGEDDGEGTENDDESSGNSTE